LPAGERIIHDFDTAAGSGHHRTDWRERFDQALQRGRDGGRITRTLGSP